MQNFIGRTLTLFWREELPWLLAGAALISLLLLRLRGVEKRALRNTLLFLALALAAELAGAALEAGGAARAGELVRSGAIVATGLALIRLAGLALFRALMPAVGVPPPRIVEELMLLLAYVGWGMLHLRLWGMDLGSLVTTSAVITAVAAFAMQDTLGNVLSGLFLELDRSVSTGDWIRLDDLSGRVTGITWRHTAIRTRNGETVVVPNSVLMKSRFVVIGNPDEEEVRWRRWVWFEVDLDVAPGRVIAAAEQALKGAEIPNVAREPAPDCALMDLARGTGRYALRYWLRDPRPDDRTDSAVRVHALAALERAGIAPSVPKEVRYEVSDDAEHRAARRERAIELRVEALRKVDLFAPLAPAELRSLAAHLVHAPFAAGDVVTRQGAVAHWLYLLVEGEAEVWIETPEAPRRHVATLGPGSVFGEMGLLTGEPRRATVRAKTDLECYRLDKPGLETILRARPALAEEISRILAARASGLAQAVEQARADAAATVASQETLLQRILAFFELDPGREGPRKAA
jgi:small-conductance mechanosensitive channel/CRP-like cAMP-binding protein